jgi:PAS domain S-box-containing protein
MVAPPEARLGGRVAVSSDAPSSAFRSLFERSRNGMLLADDERRYVAVNPAACRFLGLSSEQIVGKRIDDFTPPEARHAVEEMWRAFLEEGTQAGDYELMLPGGERRRFDYSATAQIEPDCHLAIILTLTSDPDGETAAGESPAAGVAGQRLSPRERQVMSHLAAGATGREIAELLDISPETVRNHVRNAREKLGARTKAHAIALAFHNEEIDL